LVSEFAVICCDIVGVSNVLRVANLSLAMEKLGHWGFVIKET